MTQFWPNFKSRFLGPSWADSCWHLSRQHLYCQHLSISVISQLLLTPFWPNLLDSFFAGRNSFYQSFFFIKILFDPNFFNFKFVPTIFCTQNPKNLDPTFFVQPKCYVPKILWTKNFWTYLSAWNNFTLNATTKQKQAVAELGQAMLKLDINFNSSNLN